MANTNKQIKVIIDPGVELDLESGTTLLQLCDDYSSLTVRPL